MIRGVAGLALVLALVGCSGPEQISRRLDLSAFSWLGETVFAEPLKVSLKEVNIDHSGLVGREVVVEGDVIEVGQFFTYAILSGKSARMLVVMTDLVGDDIDDLTSGAARKIRVWGVLENGQKGLPYLQARAFKAVAEAPRA